LAELTNKLLIKYKLFRTLATAFFISYSRLKPTSMYFCYVDESGDCGLYDAAKPDKTGSPYFILAGIIVAANKWKISLETMKGFRKKIAREAYLPYHIEFHCAELIDPHKVKEFTSISVPDRWKLIEEYAETIGQNTAFSIITVVIDKSKSALLAEEYLTASITKLYQAFDEFLKAHTSNGLLFFDRANEKHINTHVRKLLGTGASGETVPGVRIGWVIEDPIFRISSDSMFIQSADVVAYLLKEKEFPQASRKKHNADRIFQRKLSQICFKSKIADDDNIIRT
jgi:hypothetical protein